MARRCIANAHRLLAQRPLADSTVHHARKEIRKSRAAVRLLRVAMGGDRFERENARLRDAARALNGARDAKVLVSTLDSLLASDPQLEAGGAVCALSRQLRERRRLARLELRKPAASIVVARRTLEHTQFSALQWPVGHGGWGKLGPAFRRVYAAGRQAARRSRTSTDVHQMHEWRKHVKYLRHALQVFAPLQPTKLAHRAKLARRLADNLGDGHDLAMLRDSLVSSDLPQTSPVSMRSLLSAIDRRQLELRQRALALGAQVYADKPAELDRRLRRYWHRWRARAQ